MNITVPKLARIFLTGWATIGFSRRNLLHGCGRLFSEHSIFALCKCSLYLLHYISWTHGDKPSAAALLSHALQNAREVPAGAVTNHRVRYMLQAMSVETLGTADKLAWCSTVPNCVILQPCCIQRNIPTRCWLTTRPPYTWMDFDWVLYLACFNRILQMKNKKAIILWNMAPCWHYGEM
jgi:hypothetical protein